ncbi:DNA adenine methylase [Candidatus Amarolinea dominans]|uniref:DNA adenine methylase n=1 Tax=Candidatus Amarolinea dominans TaxID=3140696 RepID=UPI00313672F7|nr:DNA adenine methylase [Anaerolineae bacterium]
MRTPSLFDDLVLDAPPTEGIKYAGSKLKLIPQILQLIKKVNAKTVWDGFSGTTRVSQALARSGYRVISSDIAVWSEVFGVCYLLNKKRPEDYQELIDHLNAVPPVDGWFTEFYGGQPNGGCAIQPDGLKKPWQRHNTRKLDGIRREIEVLNLGRVDKAVALTSLILALDQVDSSLGHFVSYLKDWSPRSYNNLVLRAPDVFVTAQEHEVYRADVFDLAPHISVDLAYFDPPYGSNNDKMPPSRVRYASYYHVWTSVCLHDRPKLFGKARRRADTSDDVATSVFEDFRRDEDGRFAVVSAIERLIKAAKTRWIILSYSSGGRATAVELNDVLRRNGRLIEIVEIDYRKNVMAGMKWTNEWLRDAEQENHEFLFLVEKDPA